MIIEIILGIFGVWKFADFVGNRKPLGNRGVI
jgi:hypothetical protein